MTDNQHVERAVSNGTHRTIPLFRKGLRLHDNPSLVAALESSLAVFPVYVLDRAFLEGTMRMGARHWRFLLQSLEDLRMRLAALGSHLYVLQGQYEAMLWDVVTRWGITHIMFDTEVEPFYTQLDQRLHAMGHELGISLCPGGTHTLYNVSRIVEVNGGQPPLTYKKFLQVLSAIGEPSRPARDITAYDFQKCPTPVVGSEGEFQFFYTVASATPNFASMTGNPICLQINWHHDPEALEKWRSAKTGFPWIDAIMTQLRQEGWIHHLARHAVACFLTRGDLWISWEQGMKVFEEYLLDADYSVNAGNWMWLSASAFFQHYKRIFCPVQFGRRTDPDGQYLRKYLPVLKDFPSRYIYEPWTAPLDVQVQAGCVIGKNYPLPMVCHSEVSRRNLALMQHVRRDQSGTTQLTRDVTGDLKKLKLKRDYCDGQGRPNKQPASVYNGSYPTLISSCSWTPDSLSLPKLSGEVRGPTVLHPVCMPLASLSSV